MSCWHLDTSVLLEGRLWRCLITKTMFYKVSVVALGEFFVVSREKIGGRPAVWGLVI